MCRPKPPPTTIIIDAAVLGLCTTNIVKQCAPTKQKIWDEKKKAEERPNTFAVVESLYTS